MRCDPARRGRLVVVGTVLCGAVALLGSGPLPGRAADLAGAPATGGAGTAPAGVSTALLPAAEEPEPARPVPPTPHAPATPTPRAPVALAVPAAPPSHPAASATPRSTPRPAAPPISTPAALPGPPFTNRLVSGDGVLNTGVGVYTDCSGKAVVPSGIAAIDTCYTDRIYIVGHTPGVFSHLATMAVGSTITYWDGASAAHVLRVIDRRLWPLAGGATPLAAGATVQFQTCQTSDGSIDLILSAAPA